MCRALPTLTYSACGTTLRNSWTCEPAEIIELINKETNSALADSKIKAQLATLGNTVLPGSPADFGRLIAEETDKWSEVIKFASIKPE
jgi:tripartite-type tricarboxylate transporter receptor subunit TctC